MGKGHSFYSRIKENIQLWKEKSAPIFRDNSKLITQAIVTLFFIVLGIWFLLHEQTELSKVKEVLVFSKWQYILLGIVLTVVYILFQSLMYVASFRSVNCTISLKTSIILFLKRNFVSVFLPAGGVSSLAFFNNEIEKKGVSKNQIYFASTIYGFVGILSVIVVAIPIFIYAMIGGNIGSGEWIALLGVITLISLAFLLYNSFRKRDKFFEWIVRVFPSIEVLYGEIQVSTIDRRQFLITLFYSVLIEITGIVHLYIAMAALGFKPLILAAMIGYIVSVIFLIISPFLRGVGAIEVSLAFILIRFGFNNTDAVAITFLYRFFEFWLPLLAGLATFLLKLNKLLLRIIPAVLLFALGIVNLISVMTPAISERVLWLKEFIPVDIIVVSNYFVFILGLFLLVTASFMLKGLKSAWWFALFLSIISFWGNLLKAADYEEASLALFVIALLFVTKRDYYVKNDPKLRIVGIQTALLSILAVLIYGIIGFYYLDKKYFGIDFNLVQSIRYTIESFFLIASEELVPSGKFARDFILSINLCGLLSLSFLFYTLVRPYIYRSTLSDKDKELPTNLVKDYGCSALDYFKTYQDKMIFVHERLQAFIGYRVSGSFAVVLENPVAASAEDMQKCIMLFDRFCYGSGMKSIYYRVPEESLPLYRELGKKALFIGQEGIVDLNQFSLEGRSRKSIRNALSKVRERGFKSTVHQPPVKDGLLQKLKSVSDEWLLDTGRSEIVFSQGMFIWEELKQQTIVTVENEEEKIVAFLNIIPDYVSGEATYDLIRKTKDAPNGIMDFILTEMFNYLKVNGFTAVNLGFAPLSGLDDPHTFPEKSMKFAYEKIRGFSHYRGLREYKEKFATLWTNKYLIYDQDYDLLQIPGVLAKVIKP